MYVLCYPVCAAGNLLYTAENCPVVYPVGYSAVAVSELSAEPEEDPGETGETVETGEVTVSDVYDVAVTQTYLLLVIAFGVFLTCGVLLAKIFWERIK